MTIRTGRTQTTLVLLLLVGAVSADTITIRADPWLPYNGIGNRPPAGYMIEFATRIAQANGHTIQYSNMPWDDAMVAVRKGEFDCVVGAAKDDAEDFEFPTVSWGKSSNTFWAMDGTTWRYTGMGSLDQVKLIVIDGYSYSEALDAYIEQHADDGKVLVVKPIRRAAMTAISNLVARKADAVVEDVNVMRQTLKDMAMEGRVIQIGELDEMNDVYIACTPAKPRGKQYAQMFSTGLEKLRSSGELQKILDNYGLTDWGTGVE